MALKRIIDNPMTYRYLLFIASFFFVLAVAGQDKRFSTDAEDWVNAHMAEMTLKQKIAQSFMMEAFSKSEAVDSTAVRLIKEFGIGGIIFMQGSPINQLKLTNEYQQLSALPMLIATDGEWGLGMRLDESISFPYQMALGAIQNDNLIYQMGYEIGIQMKRIGLQINFSPVADVNNNPLNPVINYRSFGENKYLVTKKSIQYMRGLQDAGIMAVAKHFQGHGDTGTDSHYGLPVIDHNRERLDSLELYPFKALINAGIGGVMIAHLNVVALDDTPDLPSTLSKKIVTGVLKKELKFKGLIFTDAMNMKGVTMNYAPGKAELAAYLAGNDIIEFSLDVPTSINEIEQAMADGLISQEEIDQRCRRILLAKYDHGLSYLHSKRSRNINRDINTQQAIELNEILSAAALTVLKKKNVGSDLRGKRIATVALLSNATAVFQSEAEKFGVTDHFYISDKASDQEWSILESSLSDFDLIYAGMIQPGVRPNGKMSISNETLVGINKLAQDDRVVLSWFGNPYLLNMFEQIHFAKDLIIGYQNTFSTQKAMTQLILGNGTASGKLPVGVNQYFTFGMGIEITRNITIGAARFDQYLSLLEGKKVGLVVNPSSIVGATHLVDTLLGLGVNVTKVLAPEHGFRGDVHDGGQITDFIDEKTGVPVVSIYGGLNKPSRQQLLDVDVLVFDIQDVGVRFFTYISTMNNVMEAAAEQNKKVIILDRPNPLGNYVDGPVLDLTVKSFVGMHPIPIVHGLTIGELAHMINREGWLTKGIKCDLQVIAVAGYTHAQPWSLSIPPSPNLPNDRAIQLYPSLCLFEQTAISIGRGTQTPFQIIGSPKIKSNFSFKPVSIPGKSIAPPFKNITCYGEDLTKLDPIPKFTLSYLLNYYKKSKQKDDFFISVSGFNRLAGNDQLIKQIKLGLTEQQIRATWKEDLDTYKELRKRYLLYN